MRVLLLVLFLFGFFFSQAQIYNQADINALKAIKAKCDPNDILNWKDSNSPNTWDGVTWTPVVGGDDGVSQLDLKNKSLTDTLDVFNLSELTRLEASKNTIKHLKVAAGQKLALIDLSENDITAASFVNLSSLWYLNLEKNNISTFQLSQLPKLKILYASDNQISNLNLSSFMKLEEVTLARNLLDSVNVTGLDSLRVLGLDENRLTGVTGLSDVVLLESLYLGKNNISAIDLAGLTKLVDIELSYNNLSVFNSSNSVNLTFLGLGKNKLSTVDVSNFTKLKNLVLDSNKITSIQYTSLDSLEYLLMGANQCSKLDFNKFKNLRFLVISDNLFDTLSIDSLTNLELFHCDKNNLPLSQLEKIVKIRPIANWTDLGSTKGVLYSPQGLVYDTLKLEKGNSVNYQSEASINAVSSGINWFLNSNPIVSGDVSNNLNVFTFNKLGSYHSEMTNSSLPNLTIKTNPIIVTKITPTVTWPSFSVIDYRDTLKSATMTGGVGSGTFEFVNPNRRFSSAGTYSVSVQFTPSDTSNYKIITKDLSLTVAKYSDFDIAKLKSIKQKNDSLGLLNWTDAVSPSRWTNLDWGQLGTEYKVYRLDIQNKNLVDTLDISPFIHVIECYLSGNRLKKVVAKNLPLLFNLYIDNNELSSLELDSLPGLLRLRLDNNLLENFSLKDFSKVQLVDLYNNKLKSLTLPDSINSLQVLSVGDNLLDSLDISKYKNIHTLSLIKNKFSFSTLKQILEIKSVAAYTALDYYPQDSIFTEQNLLVGDIVDYTSEEQVKDSLSNITWYKNDTLALASDILNNNNAFTFLSSGTYLAHLSNGLLPNLTLKTKKISVKDRPLVTWPILSDVVYGDTLKSSSFNGHMGAGTFSFTKPNRTFPNAGSYKVELVFTPSDLVNYIPLKDSADINVNPRYSVNDLNILKNIKTSSDLKDSLDWRGTDYDQWTGVSWIIDTTNTEYRVDILSVRKKSLSGALVVSGLDYLVNLECDSNALVSINLSGLANVENLRCQANSITGLDASSLASLKYLECSDNKLSSLTVSNLANLKLLDCQINKLDSLKLSGLSSLEYLDCDGNELTALDISNLSSIKHLECDENKLVNLNASNLTNLEYLDCYKNVLTKLELRNLPNLLYLNCQINKLDSLNLSGLSSLEYLDCDDNELTVLDVSNLSNIKYLECDENKLVNLDVSNLTNLEYLDCYKNGLTTLELKNLPSLSHLNCEVNYLESLSLSHLDSLKELNLSHNKLTISSLKTAFDIRDSSSWAGNYFYLNQDTLFREISLEINQSVDYSAEVAIKTSPTVFSWYKFNSLVSAGDVSNAAGVFTFNTSGIYHCEMTNPQLPNLTLRTKSIVVSNNGLVRWPSSLSDITYGDSLKSAVFAGSIGTGTFSFSYPDSILDAGNHLVEVIFSPTNSNFSVSKTSLNLKVNPRYSVSDLTVLRNIKKNNDKYDQITNWSESTAYDSWSGVSWTSLGNEYRVTALAISSLDLGLNGHLNLSSLEFVEDLNLEWNSIKKISLPSLSKLKNLNLANNKLDTLDVSSLSNLEHLNCSNNSIKKLDLNNLSNIEELRCDDNKLKSLQLNSLTKLEKLYFDGNELEKVDVSSLTNLIEFSCAKNNLDSLDLSTLTKLEKLSCWNNNLNTINVSTLKKLKSLECGGNKLITLDVSDLDSLKILNCKENALTTLDISGLSKLETLNLSANNFKYVGLESILKTKALSSWANNFVYSPQNDLYSKVILEIGQTVDYASEDSVLNTASTFTWYLNDSLASVSDISKSGTVFTFNKQGVYHCKIDNSELPTLVFKTKPVVVVKDGFGAWPRIQDMPYTGDSLKNIPLLGAGGDGSFFFTHPDTILNVGTHTVELNFKPTNTSYPSLKRNYTFDVLMRYSPTDVAILKDIKSKVDPEGDLNWDESIVNYDAWGGVSWSQHANEYKVSALDLFGSSPSGLSDNYTINLLGSLDISNLSNLDGIVIYNQIISDLQLSNLPELRDLDLGYNYFLQDIQMDSLPKLTSFTYFNDAPSEVEVKNLDLSKIKNLEKLELLNILLKTLNLSHLKKLEYISIENSLLQSLDLTGLTKLEHLNVKNNHLPFSSLKTLFSIKPLSSWSTVDYFPQNKVFNEKNLLVGDTVNYASEDSVLNTATVFKWYRNDTLVSPGDISDNQRIFTFNKVGEYYCEMTNTELPSLTLRTNSIQVTKVSPSVTWPSLSDLVYGDSLKSSTFNGESGAGVFSFNKPDTTLNAGSHQIRVNFTPNDILNYLEINKSIEVKVLKARASISSLPIASEIEYNDKLSLSKLTGGQTSVSGTFIFDNPELVMQQVGNVSVDISFIPDDIRNYETIKKQLTIKVEKDEPVITNIPSDLPIVYGKALLDVVLSGGKATVEGVFKFKFETKKLLTGFHDVILQFIPKNLLYYQTKEIIVDVEVKPATPVISTLPVASEILDKQKLSVSTLSGGKGTITGTFSFKNPNQVLSIGKHMVEVIFSPTDSKNYTTATKKVEVSVKQRVLSVSKLLEIKISPNPTGGLFTIEGMKIGSDLKFFDVKGNLLFEQKVRSSKEKLDISGFAKGIYIIKNEGSYFRVQLK